MSGSKGSIVNALLHTTFGEWLVVLGLVFGGCCSNVFTLEKMVQANSESGNIVTFCQFLLVSIEGLMTHIDVSRPPFYLQRNEVPMRKWMLSVVMFFTVSVLNNCVFMFNISIPIHIIFRSSGTAVTMIIGYFYGKRYTRLQIISSIILSIGVITATLSNSSGVSTDGIVGEEMRFYIGIGILFFSAILFAVMGLYNEEIYRQHGNHWKENLFYTHFLSLPLFLMIGRQLLTEFKNIWNHGDVYYVEFRGEEVSRFSVSHQFVYLVLNCFTQFLCIRGVNMLAGATSALTVSVVLLVRKVISLFISSALFGSQLTVGSSIGAGFVFVGGVLYCFGGRGGEKEKKE